jgi:chitinase
MMRYLLILAISLFFFSGINPASAQKKAVIAYYSGGLQAIDSFDANKFTHIIYCFGKMKGNNLHLRGSRDTLLIQKMVAMKKTNKKLKVLLSLGGWGGCEPCSDVFNTETGRKEFAQSVKSLTDFFGTDGIDLDWEYPTISGFPGHTYRPEDKQNFTDLVKELRTSLGKKATITFAAGGFDRFLQESVDWASVMPLVNYVNLMTYDLVGGYAKVTGHHTPLYSTPSQKQSTDNCVQWLLKNGVEPRKLIVGAAFYSRVWEGVENTNNGLYQPGKFKAYIGYDKFLTAQNYTMYWDSVAQAPYAYNAAEKLYATFDNKRSVELKTKYVMQHKLGGIMFWQLGHDLAKGGLLDVINETLKKKK